MSSSQAATSRRPWPAWTIPLARAVIRYAPPSAAKDRFWQSVVEPYLAWQDHRFIATTVAGRIGGSTRDILQQYLYYFGTWEPRVTAFIRSRLRRGDAFIDVGANVGFFSLLAARAVGPKGHVVAVEASPHTYAELQRNVQRNNGAAAPIRLVQMAASDRRGRLTLYRGDDCNCGTATLAQTSGAAVIDAQVEAAPLDEIVTPIESERARLVKVDVEGAEAAVITGMQRLIRRGRRDCEFLVEIHPQLLAAMGRRPAEVFAAFARAGYHPYLLDNDYEASSYLRPGDRATSGLRPKRLSEPVELEWDANVVFSRADAEEL
jgi:FkbM family methyltransferase